MRLVGDDAFDPALEVAARHVHGAGEVALLPLVDLAHVDPDGAGRSPARPRVDLGDLGLGLLEQLTIGRHLYINGSGTSRHSRATVARVSPATRVRLLVGGGRGRGGRGGRRRRPRDAPGPAAADGAVQAAADAADRAGRALDPRRRRPGGVRARPPKAAAQRARAARAASAQGSGRAVQLRHRALLRRLPRRRRRRRFRQAKKAGRDTYYEMRADELLHPQFFQPQDGLYPIFEPQRPDPLLDPGRAPAARGPPALRREALRAGRAPAARTTTRRRSPRRSAASTRTTSSASFSRLGPLVKRFPHSQTVRYHLGLLLAWTGQRDAGDQGVPARTRARSEHDARQATAAFLNGLTGRWVQHDEEMSRAAYGVRPVLCARVPHPFRAARSPRGTSEQGHDRR